MDITERLRNAVAALEAAEVPDDLRSVAFAKVFDEIGDPADSSHDGGAVITRVATEQEADGLDRMASRLAVSREVAESAFVLEGETAELVIPASRLDPAKSRATEQIALLVAAARQGSGLDGDGWTSVDHIREVCEYFKRHDSSNFAATIRDMDEVFTVRGSGRDRKVRMTAPAWQRARDLLLELTAQA